MDVADVIWVVGEGVTGLRVASGGCPVVPITDRRPGGRVVSTLVSQEDFALSLNEAEP